jgi:outer membrane protein TolC
LLTAFRSGTSLRRFIISGLFFGGSFLGRRNISGALIASVTGAILLAMLAACNSEPYRSVPLNAELTLNAFAQRSLADPALAEFVRRQGRADVPWPPAQWTWSDLELVGMFYQPDLAVANARQNVAQVSAVAAQHSPMNLGLLFEHHGDTAGKPSSWSYGIDVELPVTGTDRRTARLEQANAHLDAARFDTAATNWEIQIRILRCFIEVFAARTDLALLRQENSSLAENQAMLAKRLESGAANLADLSNARQQRLTAELATSEAAIRDADALAALAKAMGVSIAALRELEFDFGHLPELHFADGSNVRFRALALHQHADLQRLLAEYAAAEAAVKLEVARQFPEFSLKPGYLWDQGDNRWSLALGWVLPPTIGNRQAIGEAEAKRQLVAQQFMARQAAIIAEIDAATARDRLAVDALTRSQALVEAARASEIRGRLAYQVGAADRIELVANQLDRLAAERAMLARRVALLHAHVDLAAALQSLPGAAGALALEAGAANREAVRQ